MQDAQQNKRLVKNKVVDDNMSMIIEYMPFLLSKFKISERDAHPASHPCY